MDPKIKKYYDVALKLVKEAGNLIRNKIWNDKSFVVKASSVDFLTETDKEVEQFLIKGLQSNFSDHKFIGEEGTYEKSIALTEAPTWIIDPIDGTMNFVHKNPFVSISVGLCIEKKPVIGIIHVPVFNYMFSAIKGHGAHLNGEKIHVSDVKALSQALIIFEGGNNREPEKMEVVQENFKIIFDVAHGIRAYGSAAYNMASVAMGSCDAYFEYGLHAWDMAAGCVIVSEAGGVVVDPTGEPIDILSCRMLCASSAELAKEMTEKIKQYYPKRDDE